MLNLLSKKWKFDRIVDAYPSTFFLACSNLGHNCQKWQKEKKMKIEIFLIFFTAFNCYETEFLIIKYSMELLSLKNQKSLLKDHMQQIWIIAVLQHSIGIEKTGQQILLT